MEKLANSATAALHERDELQKRLKISVDKRKQAKAAVAAREKNLGTRFLLKVCSSLVMQIFRHIFQGIISRT